MLAWSYPCHAIDSSWNLEGESHINPVIYFVLHSTLIMSSNIHIIMRMVPMATPGRWRHQAYGNTTSSTFQVW